MSSYHRINQTCALCGKTSTYNVLVSTSAFGAMDLDTRPPALKRYTNRDTIQTCPHCGYVNYTVDTKTNLPAEFVRCEAYTGIEKSGLPEMAIQFYKHAEIAKAEKDDRKLFWAYLRAAWECDDAQDYTSAIKCRKDALAVLTNTNATIMGDVDALHIMTADLLRRTGQFDTVIESYSQYQGKDAFLNKLIQYEVKLAKQQDAKCHSVDEV